MLTGAAAASGAGATALGESGSALLVAALALLAAITGFCTGCEAYKLGCRLSRAAVCLLPAAAAAGLTPRSRRRERAPRAAAA